MFRIALFGGTFDPFHLAHLRMVEHIWSLQIYDQIIVMPTGPSPHKERRISFAGYRYESARLAVREFEEKVSVSSEEITSRGASYTIFTVKKLRDKFISLCGDAVKIDLLIGSDSLQTVEKWYQADLLLRKVGLLVAVRNKELIKEIRLKADSLRQKYGTEIRLLELEPLTISSTEIRGLLQANESAEHLLPASVSSFLTQNRVYSFVEAMSELSDESWDYLQSLEQIQWPLLDEERRVHVLNVMQYAVELARLHDVDLRKTAIAALLHDIAKYLPLKQQYEYAGDFFEQLNDKIVHAPASANFAREQLNIEDEEIWAAICYHTTSHPQNSDLGKIIYLADKIEYGREYKSLPPIRRMAEKDLDRAMLLCMKEVFVALSRQGFPTHPYSKAHYESIIKKYASDTDTTLQKEDR
ncbi:MAG TPA: nicotinate (nicotinamide) nucleotide adenylyltransferase [Clostridiaceae bacterium]|nr:nicotinate (nicotinamide) nucleotide adenylyltransferase [Clostridiaceae bacterium]